MKTQLFLCSLLAGSAAFAADAKLDIAEAGEGQQAVGLHRAGRENGVTDREPGG